MYLRRAYDKRKKRTYLSIVHGYRDSNGKSKSTTIQALGYLDDLEKTYNDPIYRHLFRFTSLDHVAPDGACYHIVPSGTLCRIVPVPDGTRTALGTGKCYRSSV